MKNTVANATARVAGDIDVNSFRWAKSLFARMNFVKRRKTSSKVDIPDKACKEIEFSFLHEIVTKVEKHNISPELVLNIDMFPLAMKLLHQEVRPRSPSKEAQINFR